MNDLDAAVVEDAGHEQAAVAVRRVLLAAHDGEAIVAEAALQPLDARHEELRLGDAPIEDVAVLVVVLVCFRSAAELAPEEAVLDRRVRQRGLECNAIDLRRKAAVLRGADVEEDLDVLLAQEPEEVLEGVAGVADGQELPRRHAAVTQKSILGAQLRHLADRKRVIGQTVAAADAARVFPPP
jgi:hypothetical protein